MIKYKQKATETLLPVALKILLNKKAFPRGILFIN